MAMMVTTDSTAPKILRLRSMKSLRIMLGSSRTMFSRLSICGDRTNHSTAETTTSLISPLPKFTSASTPIRRLAPSIGLILLSLGFSGSSDSSGLCCTRLAATPKTMSTIEGSRPTRRIELARLIQKACSAWLPTSKRSAFSRMPLRLATRLWLIGPAIRAKTSAAPDRMNQVFTSWLLATLPFSCASRSFRSEGSSVFWSCSGASSLTYTPRSVASTPSKWVR